MSRGELVPGENEGEPTWWDRYGERLMNFSFSLSGIINKREQTAEILGSVLPDSKGNIANKRMVLQEFVNAMPKQPTLPDQVSLSALKPALLDRLKKIQQGKSTQDGIRIFIEAVVTEFFLSNQEAVYELFYDDEFRRSRHFEHPKKAAEDVQAFLDTLPLELHEEVDEVDMADPYYHSAGLSLFLRDRIFQELKKAVI